jgi:hypothetical protein
MKGGHAPLLFILSAIMVLALSELHLCSARFHPHMIVLKLINQAAIFA